MCFVGTNSFIENIPQSQEYTFFFLLDSLSLYRCMNWLLILYGCFRRAINIECVCEMSLTLHLRNDRSTVGAQLIRHSVVSNLISDRKLHKNSKS